MINMDGQEISVSYDIDQGARITSLQWRDLEFVLPQRNNALDWGWYAMAPWAGRVGDGILIDEAGNEHQLPINLGAPHAIHGYGFMSQWEDVAHGVARLHLPGPYEGAVVEQRIEILDDAVRYSLEYEPNGCKLPAWLGVHPWFPREIARGNEAEIEFAADLMFSRDSDGLPTGDLVKPGPRPWDDCFTQIRGVPQVVYEGAARIYIESDAPYWVVYDEDQEGVCVEPQTAPPDAANLDIKGEHYLEVLFTFEEDF